MRDWQNMTVAEILVGLKAMDAQLGSLGDAVHAVEVRLDALKQRVTAVSADVIGRFAEVTFDVNGLRERIKALEAAQPDPEPEPEPRRAPLCFTPLHGLGSPDMYDEIVELGGKYVYVYPCITDPNIAGAGGQIDAAVRFATVRGLKVVANLQSPQIGDSPLGPFTERVCQRTCNIAVNVMEAYGDELAALFVGNEIDSYFAPPNAEPALLAARIAEWHEYWRTLKDVAEHAPVTLPVGVTVRSDCPQWVLDDLKSAGVTIMGVTFYPQQHGIPESPGRIPPPTCFGNTGVWLTNIYNRFAAYGLPVALVESGVSRDYTKTYGGGDERQIAFVNALLRSAARHPWWCIGYFGPGDFDPGVEIQPDFDKWIRSLGLCDEAKEALKSSSA